MGIIQGVTEFLPVSSSGHLAIFKALFHVEAPGLLFDVMLHVGTLVAVFLCFYKDILQLLAELGMMIADIFRNFSIWFSNLNSEERRPYHKVISNGYRKFDVLLIMATIPTGIIGVFDSDLVEKMSGILLCPGICLLVTGVILLVADRLPEGEKSPKNTTFSNAFLIGIAQGIATLPGISRSGSTIAACLGSGFKKTYAVRFSFILSIPAILGSLIFELLDVDLKSVVPVDVAAYLVGAAVAAVVGFICIRVMLVIVKRQKFFGFSIYCFLMGAVSIIAFFVLR